MMEVLDFPPEILHLILVHATLGRGVKRALRLRIVCKAFACLLYPALFETHLMDRLMYEGYPLGSMSWKLWNQHGADRLWHEYLVYRTLGERDATVGRFVELHEIADAICCLEPSRVLHETVEALCWLVLRHEMPDTEPAQIEMMGGDNGRWRKSGCTRMSKQRATPDRALNMLTAAAHFNIVHLAKGLLASGVNPTQHDNLFAPPIQVAAQTGNTALLRLFQKYLPKSKFEPWSVTGAAIRGDVDIAKLALRLPKRMGKDMQVYGSLDHTTEPGMAILRARVHTSNIEVYEYLSNALAPWETAWRYAYADMIEYAQLGNLLMVRHLLSRGVPAQLTIPYAILPDPASRRDTPLVMACNGLHDDMVDLLFEHGADPNFAAIRLWPTLPLHGSATVASISLSRKLLDRGALPNAPSSVKDIYPAIWWAVAREHTKLIDLLLERGASFHGTRSPWIGRALANMACYLGLHSMADILRKHGFHPIAPICNPRTAHRDWCAWEEAKLVNS